MAGTFTVSLSEDLAKQPSVRADKGVIVTVSSINGYKGTVSLTYAAITSNPPPDYIYPTSGSVYVPKNGAANALFSVGVPAGATIVVEAVGSDATKTAAGTITLTE